MNYEEPCRRILRLFHQGKILGHFVRRITLVHDLRLTPFLLTLSVDSFRSLLFLSSSSLLFSLSFFLFKLNCNMFVFSPRMFLTMRFSIAADVKAFGQMLDSSSKLRSKFNKVQFTQVSRILSLVSRICSAAISFDPSEEIKCASSLNYPDNRIIKYALFQW